MEFCRGMSRLIIFIIFLYNFHNIILYCNTTNNGKVLEITMHIKITLTFHFKFKLEI